MAPGSCAFAAITCPAPRQFIGLRTSSWPNSAHAQMAWMTRRSVLEVLLMTTARVVATEQRASMTKIFADEPWYRERRELERDWEGVLAERKVGVGPNTRTALGHVLQIGDRNLPVYTPSSRATF